MDVRDLCISCFNPTGGEEVCMHCGFVQSDKPKQLCHLYPHTILNGRYIIGHVINNGGFGVVYKAYDMKLENVVAIKELLPTQNGMVNRMPQTTEVIPVNEERGKQFNMLKKRFLDEARMMAQFTNCDSIVHIYDFFEANNTAYLIMEYLDGVTLRQYLDANGRKMDYETAIGIMLPIMEALKVVHAVNVVHRDVSPDNIFICANNKVKLIDFGAAKFSANENNNSVVMKPGYTPPEQYRTKGTIGAFTDIYSVGAVLYTILSGEIPEESIDRVEKDNLEKLSKIGVQVPIHVEKSIMKALALKENARFKNMAEFIGAIKGEKKADYPEVELKKKKIFRTVTIAAAFIVMVASVLSVYFVKSSNNIIPKESTTITLWYADDGDKALNARWDSISSSFSEYALRQNADLKDMKLEVVGVPVANYEQKLQEAFANGTAPDIYEATSDKFDEHAQSLNNVYASAGELDFKPVFRLMKDEYKSQNKIAVCFDMPALYSYTDFDYSDKEVVAQTNLNELQKKKLDTKYFDYTLLCNPDVVESAGVAYGNDNNSVKILKKAANTAKSKTPSTEETYHFLVKNGGEKQKAPSGENAQYYIGWLSEYSAISKDSRTGQSSFAVQPLTGEGIKNVVVYPELWSISASSKKVNQQASALLLYFLLSSEDGQSEITQANKNTYYLPMYSSAVEKIGYADEYNLFYESKNELISVTDK